MKCAILICLNPAERRDYGECSRELLYTGKEEKEPESRQPFQKCDVHGIEKGVFYRVTK